MISSSDMRRMAARVGTVPSRVFAARSRRALALEAERPAAAEHFVGGLQQVLGGGVQFAERGEQAFEYGCGGCAVELLINDGLEQRLKGGVLAFEFEREGSGALMSSPSLGSASASSRQAREAS